MKREEVKNMLKKLQEAREAGILTEEEYNSKVSALEGEAESFAANNKTGVENENSSEAPEDSGFQEFSSEEGTSSVEEDDGIVYFDANDNAQKNAGSDAGVSTAQNPTGSVGGSKKKGKKKWIIIGGIILVLIIIGAIGSCNHEETYDWPTNGLAKMLPEPDGSITDVYSDSEEANATVKISNEDYFDEYVEQCKEMGFNMTKDVGYTMYSDKSYTAFNKDGYKLNLGYDDYDEPELEINLHRPIKSNDINWPTSGIGKSLPKPDSMKGELVYETEEDFDVYVAGTSLDDYDAYVKAVMNAGYKKDYDKGDYEFNAYHKDSEDVGVEVQYYGNQIMYISVYDYREDSDKGEIGGDKDSDDSSETSSDFKATMDEYEAFMDDYIAFMEKYNDSDDTSGMLTDYAEMLEKYGEFTEKIDAIDEDSLSESDYAYYIEVTTRVANKLEKANID